MPIKPKYSVYIVSHNYGHYVEQAIQSVFEQTESNWELLLIDDGSTDSTSEIFKKYEKDSRIRTFNTNGIGLNAVCNFALNEALGDFIIRLDGDDYFDENILLVLGNHMIQDPSLGIVYSDHFLVDKDGKKFSYEFTKKINKNEDSIEPPNGACCLIDAAKLKKIGGYNINLNAQDGLDLWLKMKDHYKTKNINLPLYYYRRHGNNLTETPYKIINARREIKQKKASKIIELSRPIIAIIPCRQNHDFTGSLWSKEINGISLLERDVNICTKSEYFDKIIITCDENIEQTHPQIFQKDNRIKFFLRDESLTSKSVKIEETLNLIAKNFDAEHKGIMLMRYIQTPFITHKTLEEAINSLLITNNDSLIAVEKIRHEIFENKNEDLIQLNYSLSENINTSNFYRDSSTCSVFKTRNLKNGQYRGNKILGMPVSAAESFFINSFRDLEIASSSASLNY